MPRRTANTERITSIDKMSKINKSNLELMEDFLTYLKSLQRSPGTIKGYRSDLTILFTYMLDHMSNKEFRRLNKRDIIRLQNWLVEAEVSPARIRRFKAAMSSLANYCENILADDDPDYEGYRAIVRKVESPPLQPVREKTVWSEDEIQDILDKLVERQDYQKACFIALAAYGGRRKAELCRFKVSDFGDDKLVCDGALYRSDPILTKGGKKLNCYTLAKKFKPYFDMWMEQRKNIGIESEWLFPHPTNPEAQTNPHVVDKWTPLLCKLSGKDFYMHSLRHGFVSMLIRNGIPEGVVQAIVGWQSISMVNTYDDNPVDDKIGLYFKNGEIDTSNKHSITDI